ncbi:hypothetical protein QTP88_008653 [Uroleucon formosanum]
MILKVIILSKEGVCLILVLLSSPGFEWSLLASTVRFSTCRLITKQFVYRTIKRFNEFNTIDDKPRSGRPREIRTNAAVKAVAQRISRNPLRKQKVMAREMKIPPRTMSRIIKEDLGLGAYRRSTGQRLTDALRQIRTTRAKRLLKRYAKNGHRQILFTDEKIFTVEEKFNCQNDRVHAHNSREAAEKIQRVERGHHPASVMGVKTRAVNYQNDTLEKVVKPLSITLFVGKNWTLQQDSAPANKAKTTHNADWPSGSPDLNPLDYRLWNILEEKACSKPHRNIESLKADLVKSAASIPLEVVRAVIDEWPDRLKKCINANGGHFE